MNTEPESSPERFLAWLLQYPNSNGSEFSPHSGNSPLSMGEIPTVQNRFQALLKRRLQAEIHHRPPLFPWETEVVEYEPDYADALTQELGSCRPWIAQLGTLNLPIPLPENLFAQLLEQCQATAQSSLREGARLVQAVTNLFPGDDALLNQLAGLVMTAPARSGMATLPNVEREFPSNYEEATRVQQMLISLLTAREILAALSLTLSPNRLQAERQWFTTVGKLALVARYQPQVPGLQVTGRLPCGGSLQLQGQRDTSTSDRQDGGHLRVELLDVQPGQLYQLQVRLHLESQEPLNFVIRVLEQDQ